MSRRYSNSKGSEGCLWLVIAGLIIAGAIWLYSFFWIAAIPAGIYFFKSKKFEVHRTRNVIICSAVFVTSIVLFAWMNLPSPLQGISADWGDGEFELSTTEEISVSHDPSDAEVDTLELYENDIAELMDYSDGVASVKFKKAGEAELFFIANGEITSAPEKITVIDPVQKEKEEKERLRKQREKEKKEREREEQEEASSAADNDPVVYITNTGSKYHTSGCRMLKSKIETHLSAVRGSYGPCGVCHPPQ